MLRQGLKLRHGNSKAVADHAPGTAFQRLVYPSCFIANVNFFCLRDRGFKRFVSRKGDGDFMINADGGLVPCSSARLMVLPTYLSTFCVMHKNSRFPLAAPTAGRRTDIFPNSSISRMIVQRTWYVRRRYVHVELNTDPCVTHCFQRSCSYDATQQRMLVHRSASDIFQQQRWGTAASDNISSHRATENT